jgi:hypothetical protein
MEKNQVNLNIDFNGKQTIQQQFERIADELMNKWKIICGKQEYRITELEFYLHHPKYHPDPFVHCNTIQTKYYHWYFHSGIDITFGDGTFYGGILIRGLLNMSSNKPIQGISRIKELIQTNLNNDLIAKYQNSTINECNEFTIKKAKYDNDINQFKGPIKGPRVRIVSKCSNWGDFLFKPYRYVDALSSVETANEKYFMLLYYLYTHNQLDTELINNLKDATSYEELKNKRAILNNFDRTPLQARIIRFFKGFKTEECNFNFIEYHMGKEMDKIFLYGYLEGQKNKSNAETEKK